MSRYIARELLRDAITQFMAANYPLTPFVETINESQRPDHEQWVTVEFTSDFTDPYCYDRDKNAETGTAEVYVFTRAGTGDQTAIQMADAIEDYFLQTWTSDQVQVVGTVSASEATGGDISGRWYGAAVSLNYVNYF